MSRPPLAVAFVVVLAVVLVVAGAIDVGKAVIVVVIVLIGSLLGLRVGGGGPRDGSPPSSGPGSSL